MNGERHTVFEIDGVKTLPLYVLYGKTQESIPGYTSGKVNIHYLNPEYDIPQFTVDHETLKRMGSDSGFVLELTKKWHEHSTKFMYFTQFSDDRVSERGKALHAHTELISILCDSRLRLDPSSLWQSFDWLITFHSIQSRYRDDPDRDKMWQIYADQLEKAHEEANQSSRDSMRLLQRIQKQIELQADAWLCLPALTNARGDTKTEDLMLFYSYSHKDEKLRDHLENHLSLLRRQGVITTWHDRRIAAGREWEGQIDSNLEAAHVILLLVSSDSLASDYCYDIELKRAIEKHSAGTARVIPIIIRACDWTGTPFGKLQALPKDAKPVRSWSNLDEAFTDVAKGIRTTVSEIISNGSIVM